MKVNLIKFTFSPGSAREPGHRLVAAFDEPIIKIHRSAKTILIRTNYIYLCVKMFLECINGFLGMPRLG